MIHPFSILLGTYGTYGMIFLLSTWISGLIAFIFTLFENNYVLRTKVVQKWSCGSRLFYCTSCINFLFNGFDKFHDTVVSLFYFGSKIFQVFASRALLVIQYCLAFVFCWRSPWLRIFKINPAGFYPSNYSAPIFKKQSTITITGPSQAML
jgi:hypothetical protein